MKKLWALLFTLVFAVGIFSPAVTTTADAANGVVMTVNDAEYTDFMSGWQYAVSTAKKGTQM